MLIYPVSALSQFNENRGGEHWKVAKRVLRYLKGTQDLGLTFGKTNKELIGYADADWADNTGDRRSYSSFAFELAGAAINWSQLIAKIEYILTVQMPADMFMKGLTAPKHLKCTEAFGLK